MTAQPYCVYCGGRLPRFLPPPHVGHGLGFCTNELRGVLTRRTAAERLRLIDGTLGDSPSYEELWVAVGGGGEDFRVSSPERPSLDPHEEAQAWWPGRGRTWNHVGRWGEEGEGEVIGTRGIGGEFE